MIFLGDIVCQEVMEPVLQDRAQAQEEEPARAEVREVDQQAEAVWEVHALVQVHQAIVYVRNAMRKQCISLEFLVIL